MRARLAHVTEGLRLLTISGGAVALAARSRQALGVDDVDASVALMDKPFSFKTDERVRDLWPRHAEHVRDAFLRQLDGVRLDASATDEQPPTEPRRERVMRR